MKDKNYKRLQIDRSNKKWGSKTFWEYSADRLESQIEEVYEYNDAPDNIICLGIRDGNEYKFFKENGYTKDSKVYGIDINPIVEDVGDNCYCYDFSKLPKEYKNKFDLVYSNSIDHALDLDITIKEWHRICKRNAIIVFCKLEGDGIIDIHSFKNVDEIKKLTKNYFDIVKVWESKNNITVFFKKKNV